jgi:hypothetical protein
MPIRDRGLIKWAPAHFAPELRSSLGGLKTDYYSIEKPMIDMFQYDEFDQHICYSIEFHLLVKITTWGNGFKDEVNGRVHFMDPIGKEVRLKTENGSVMKIKFSDIIDAVVIE